MPTLLQKSRGGRAAPGGGNTIAPPTSRNNFAPPPPIVPDSVRGVAPMYYEQAGANQHQVLPQQSSRGKKSSGRNNNFNRPLEVETTAPPGQHQPLNSGFQQPPPPPSARPPSSRDAESGRKAKKARKLPALMDQDRDDDMNLQLRGRVSRPVDNPDDMEVARPRKMKKKKAQEEPMAYY
ncbi:unnamed protein product [Amoebophrya sp. A120]|nr:unnamed protein product [Amoebophrya sp. A120]|eukprot:GSA120T00000414001.1